MREEHLIKSDIAKYDSALLELLIRRMQYIQELTEVKKEHEGAFFEQSVEQARNGEIDMLLKGNCWKSEILEIVKQIHKSSQAVEAKILCPDNLFLIGFMGTGKSTVAQQLSTFMQADVIEMDQAIVEEQGMEITDIFAKFGEEHFRNIESKFLKKIKKKSRCIVSCGGGVVVRPENAEYMKKNGKVILLMASPETVYQRVRYSKERPILNENMSVEHIEQLMEKRRELYMGVADLIIDTDGKDPVQICQDIAAGLVQLERERT